MRRLLIALLLCSCAIAQDQKPVEGPDLSRGARPRGWFYLNGVGVERDIDQAKKWYRKSARRGQQKAMFSLGQIAYDERDFSDALNWFTRASEAGHVRSLYWLGKLYWRGLGVEHDKKQAMRFFHRAASNKVAEAQRVLRFLR